MEVVLDVLIPLYMGKLIDNGIGRGDMSYVWKCGIALAVMCLLSLGFGALSGHSAAVAAMGFGKNLRHDMFHHVQSYSFSNIDKFSSSSIVTRLTTDVTNIQNAFMMTIRVAVRAPGMLILSMIMAFQINGSLAMVFLIALPILGIGIFAIMKSVHPIFRRVFKTYDRLNQVVQENLRGIRVVKSFVREDHEIEKFDQVSDTIYKDFTKAETIIAFNAPLMNFCAFGCMTLVAWIGARLIITTHEVAMSTGQLTTMISYVMQILMSLMFLSMIAMQIILSRASAERIVEILDEKSTLESPAEAVEVVKDGSIVFDHVTFAYDRQRRKAGVKGHRPHHPLRRDHRHPGAARARVNPAWCSSFPALRREGRPGAGGRRGRAGDYDLEVLRDQVAMVLQKNVLFSGTIKDNLRWGKADATDEEMIHACTLSQADGFIREFPDGYDTYIEQGGTNVSGGQRQRLCIARALLKKPKILILDDSTSAVDTHTDAMIRKAFLEEIPDTTKIIIAQRVSSVEDADRIIVLQDGQINGFGTHEELLRPIPSTGRSMNPRPERREPDASETPWQCEYEIRQ